MSSASASCTASRPNHTDATASGSDIIGRFAPSPSGPLHLGSLLSALASFLDARSRDGLWLLRIDDLDGPRSVAGSSEQIYRALEHHGLEWDGTVSLQSNHQAQYISALNNLDAQGVLYHCNCTRKMVAGRPYPGTCRWRTVLRDEASGPALRNPMYALRLRVPSTSHQINFEDELLGKQEHNLAAHSGDFIVRRADGLVSYQLAVVIDDALSGVNRVVRGADLLDSTPRQILLHQLLGLPVPAYLHLPVLLNRRGTKLSKQAHALALDNTQPAQNLHLLLQLLHQSPPNELQFEPPAKILAWAIRHWRAKALPKTPELTGYIAH